MAAPLFTLTAGDGLASRIGTTREALAGAKLILRSNVKTGDMVIIDGGLELVDEVVVVLDEDGKINGDTGITLLADDESLGLENSLQWQINIKGARSQGFARSVTSWWINAGASGSTVSLDEQPKVPGQVATGTTRGPRGYSLDDLSRDGDELVGSVQGTEVGRVDISDLVFTGGMDDINDAGDVGKDVARSETAADIRSTIGLSQRIMRPNGPNLGNLGDSLSSLGTASTSSSMTGTGGPIILRRIEWMTHRRVQMWGLQSDPGDTMNDVLTTQLPALLAMSVLPNACAVAIGRNDVGASFNLATYLASYEDIAKQLFSVGVCPIFLTPMPTGAAGSPTATADANLRRLGEGLRGLGPKLGVPVFDQYAVLADETGGLKAAYNSGDNVHLTAAGYHAVAKSLIVQGFPDLFPQAIPTTIKDTASSADIMAGSGLFKSDTPTGFAAAGTGTAWSAYQTPSEVDGVAGRWAKVVKTNGSTAAGAWRWTSSAGAVTAGKKYRVSGRAKIDGTWGTDLSPANYLQISLEWRNGSSTVSAVPLVNRWDQPEQITFSEDLVAPATTDGARLVAYLNGTATTDQGAYFAEWSIRNLTDMGL